MTMHKQSYVIKQFQSKIQQITTINQLVELAKTQKFDLEIDLIHRKTSVLTWRPAEDSFSGEYNLLVYPKIAIDGKNFAPHKVFAVKFPENIGTCEVVFLKALKNAINSAEQVWN